jgi:hypothetical protein
MIRPAARRCRNTAFPSPSPSGLGRHNPAKQNQSSPAFAGRTGSAPQDVRVNWGVYRDHGAITELAVGVGPRVRIRLAPADSPCLAGYSPPTSKSWLFPRVCAGLSAALDLDQCSHPHFRPYKHRQQREHFMVQNTIRAAWLAEVAELRERARLACEAMRHNIDDYRLIAARRRLGNGTSIREPGGLMRDNHGSPGPGEVPAHTATEAPHTGPQSRKTRDDTGEAISGASRVSPRPSVSRPGGGAGLTEPVP